MASASASASVNKTDHKIAITTTTTPATFIQAEPWAFKEVVQKLTGAPQDSPDKLIPVVAAVVPRRSKTRMPIHNKLQERRRIPAKLELVNLHHKPLPPHSSHPRLLHYYYCHYHGHYHYHNNNVVSPVSNMDSCYFFSSPSSASSPLVVEEDEEEESSVIAKKGFYFHPSPKKCDGELPKLLPLFPLTSPKHANN